MENLISVIIPVYKVEPFLDKCIESVVKQTYHNLEIILVDDGSPDRCGDICDNWETRDHRIKVIHKVNGGLSDARNAGLDIASGDYIGFVDSDDWIEPNMYEVMLNKLLQNNADIAICGMKKIYKTRTELQDLGHDWRYSRQKALYELIQNKSLENFAQNKLYKKELFEGLRFPKGRIFEDVLLMYKIFDRVNRVVHINQNLYNYLRHDNSILGSWSVKIELEFCIAKQERLIEMMQNHPEFNTLLITDYMNSFWSIKKRFMLEDVQKSSEVGERITSKLYPFFIKNHTLIQNTMRFNVLKKMNYILYLKFPLLYKKLYRLIK